MSVLNRLAISIFGIESSSKTQTIAGAFPTLRKWRFAPVAFAIALAFTPLYGQVNSPLFSLEKAELHVTTVDGATTVFNVVSVTSREDQSRGLMHVRFMPLDQGMVFAYTRDRTVSMWMKNTHIPLDMWFVTKDGTVSKVVRNTEPMSLDPISSDQPIRAVVEVNAGLSALIGVTEGTKLLHSAFSRDSAERDASD